MTGEVAVSPKVGIAFSHHLWHVEFMSLYPSGAGRISHLNVIILGEPLESEENDLVFPSQEFSSQALVCSPEQVYVSFILLWKPGDCDICYCTELVYRNMYKKSIEDPVGFWSEIASQFYWKEKSNLEVYTENINVRKGTVKFEEFSLDPVLHPLTARPDHVERALSARYHDAMTILQPQGKELDLLIVILPDNNGSLYGMMSFLHLILFDTT
ncbi:hypothetical protein ZIOFF_059707 [Zingiber officinale]|uniref:Acetyl-coenzyme A synthetase N-terminal domain-containing protein n=1 Tax=Zingiber officinale TaxID=94328 RepID=A0A8J5F9S5_ZINOF|nr:hypothetical protein ZIOFF_059707 [Zingiber officinale]